MPFGKCKIYSDGSHFIAIPHVPRKHKKKTKQSVTRSSTTHSVSLREKELIPLSSEEEREYSDFLNYVKNYYAEKNVTDTAASTRQDTSLQEVFDNLYEESKDKGKFEQRKRISSQMLVYFKDENEATRFINEQFARKRHNMLCRKKRLFRKINLQEFNFFCTFTFDDKKHTEETFRKKLKDCFKMLCFRKGWKYIGVWERSPEKKRLHFHGLFYIPENGMVGEFTEVEDYNFNTHNRQKTMQNSYFNEKFGRSDFQKITHKIFLSSCVSYIVKYMEKTGEKLVYSRNLPQYFISDVLDDDIVCRIGTGEQKLLLFDDFSCFDEGTYIGQASRKTIEKMPKSN